MYSFVSSLVRVKGLNNSFKNIDLSRVRITEIFQNYEGYLELSTPSLTDHTHVTIEDLRSNPHLVFANLPLNDWLAVQGNTTIVGSVDSKPYIKEHACTFSDAIQAGFNIRRVNPRDVEGKNNYISDQLTDIFAMKNIGDQTLLHRRVLTSVNGLFHINIPQGNGLLIKSGGTSFSIEQDNHVGILSFENVADVEQVVMRREMFQPAEPLRPYRQSIYMNLKKDLRGKSIILSLAGRLFINKGLIEIINFDGAIRINTSLVDLFRIVQESIGKIDTRSLKLDEKLFHLSALTPENCTDDETVAALFELMQTFIILVDTPYLVTELEALMYPNSPGYYERYINSKAPYVDNLGVMHSYWKIIHRQKYQNVHRFHLKNTVYTNAVRESGGWLNPSFRYNTQYQYRNHRQFHTGHLMKIVSQEIRYE